MHAISSAVREANMRDAVGAPVPEVLTKCASLTQLTRENAIECILRHFRLARGVRVHSATDPSDETILDPRLHAPSRLRHQTGYGVLRHLKRPTAPARASRPVFSDPGPPAAALFDFRVHSCHSAAVEKRVLSASYFRPIPRRAKGHFLTV